MQYDFITDFKCVKGDINDIYREFSLPYDSPTLSKLKVQTIGQKIKKAVTLDEIDDGENTDEDYAELSEDRIDAELEDLDEEDYEDFAGLILAGIDWLFEKALNNFFNRRQVKETKSQERKLKRLKIIGRKVLMKHSVRFKIEFLFGAMLVGYMANRYRTAEVIDKEKEKAKKDKKNAKKGIKNIDFNRGEVQSVKYEELEEEEEEETEALNLEEEEEEEEEEDLDTSADTLLD